MIRVAQFDQRLTLLEKVLGVSASAVVNVDRQLPSNAMIPTLDELSRQMGVLNTSTIASLDAASRRVKQLLSDAEKLADARKAAKSMTVDDGSSIDSLENEETISKINALYGVLPTIEKTTPLLFAILDRLRSLRAIHQDAATSSETLKKIESRQDEIGAEIKTWEESLVNMEGLVKEGQGTIESNMGKVEGWVKELEEKMMAVK
jgi:nuclear migration protein JNM1